MDRHAKSIFFNFRPDNRIITFAPPSASISPFPVRFDQVNSTCLARNLIFYLKVALLVKPIYYRFVHTSSTHGPHIKSTSRAISQYIHCWEYFQWVKSYTYLKFRTMRVSHLCLSASFLKCFVVNLPQNIPKACLEPGNIFSGPEEALIANPITRFCCILHYKTPWNTPNTPHYGV